jgi:TctA family transporter
MLENALRQSLSMSHGDPLVFVTRPLAVVLILSGVLLTAWSLLARRRA